MINLALRNVRCVYDKDDKCIGKFIVNSSGNIYSQKENT